MTREPTSPEAAGDAAPVSERQSERKSARTRALIIDAALRLFRERGYDATTMRAIAAEAGVSVGNAYYYFSSKEELVQGFYDRVQEDHAVAARPLLDTERDLTARIVGVIGAWIDLIEPYRAFAGKFFKNAAEPTSPLSPFSQASTRARELAIDLWREVVDGSDARIPKRMRPELPELLWLYFMGIVLFWVHDASDDAAATRRIAARSAPLVVRAIGMTRLPVMRGMVDEVVALVAELKQIFPADGVRAAPPDDRQT